MVDANVTVLMQMLNLFLLLLSFAVPAIILYFIIKAAVKKAVRELKEEGIIGKDT
ncbi:MAG: hypothetical protein IBX71_06935 [Candidatus Desulforudis sp.]|nr:hypothetical protein [Desulforudis sp.]